MTNGTAGTEVDTSGRARRHVFGQRIKRGRAVIPLDVTVAQKAQVGGKAGMRHLRRKTQVAARQLSKPQNKRGNYLTANPDGTVGEWVGAGIMEARRAGKIKVHVQKALAQREGWRVNCAPPPAHLPSLYD